MKHITQATLGVLLFASVIVIHEGGHLLASLWYGFPVEEFSVGFGPLLAQVDAWGLSWSLRAIPLGGYCKVDVPDGPSWGLFVMLSAGIFLNLVLGVLGMVWSFSKGKEDVRLKIPDSWREYQPFENAVAQFVYRILAEFVFLFLFPFVAIWEMGRSALVGSGVMAWASFHLMLGISNLLPLFPFLDGAKMGGVTMSSVTGGDWGVNGAIISLMFILLVVLGTQWLRRKLPAWDEAKKERELAEAETTLKDLSDSLVAEGWLVSYSYEWNEKEGCVWVEFNASKQEGRHVKFSMPGDDMSHQNVRTAMAGREAMAKVFDLGEIGAEVTMVDGNLKVSVKDLDE